MKTKSVLWEQISRAAQMLSTLMMIMAAAPIIGSLLGGALINISSWRLIFWLMIVIGIIMFLSVYLLPETLSKERRSHESIIKSFENYRKLLQSKKFMIYTMSVTFFYVAVYAFITGSSDIYINYFNVKPEIYSVLFGVNILGVSLMSMVNQKSVNHFDLSHVLALSTGFAFLGITHSFGLWGSVIPMFLIFSTNDIVAASILLAAIMGWLGREKN